ncbi:hypothetical protein LPJ79_004093 [Coemansia sp. RSA 1821]|nr:hypothetical protein LPJ79_004093 [Coemansia sp. RSA 1821]
MGFTPVEQTRWVPRKRQDGRRFIVTGANRGIGYATAAGLAALGAQVVLVGHEGSDAFGEAIDRIVQETGCERDALSYMALDLSSTEGVRQFVRMWKQRPASESKIHGLINNAGIAGAPGVSPDGFELCFQINYLSMFLLTRSLLPFMEAMEEKDKKVPARIVCVSSSAHLFTLGIPTDEGYLRKSGGGFFSLRYGESKLCVNSFVRTLHKRLRDEHPDKLVDIVAVHPGSTSSGFWHSFPAWAQRCIATVAQDPSQGARTSLYCATEPGVVSGGYYADCAPAAASFWLNSMERAEDLWTKSSAWTGMSPFKLAAQ